MDNTKGHDEVIRLMCNAIDEAQSLIVKSVEMIMKDCKSRAIEILSNASAKLDMENLDAMNGKEYQINDPVWFIGSGKGIVAGRITGISYNGEYFVSLIAGPDKFNQQVKAKESQLRRRK